MATIKALLRLATFGCTVTIQNFDESSADYLKFWDPVSYAWVDSETQDTKLALVDSYLAGAYGLSIDTTPFVGLRTLRLVYRDPKGVILDDELVFLSPDGVPSPQIEELLPKMVEPREGTMDEFRWTRESMEVLLPQMATWNPIVVPTQDQDGNTSYQVLWQITQEFEPPQGDVAEIRVLWASTYDAQMWSQIYSEPYTGQTSITFTSDRNAYFRLAFVDSEGHQGPLSEVFTVPESNPDADLTWRLSSDCKVFRAGEKRFITLEVSDSRNEGTVLVGGQINVYDPAGTLYLSANALIDGQEMKALLDFTKLMINEEEVWQVRGVAYTLRETILSKKFSFRVLPE